MRAEHAISSLILKLLEEKAYQLLLQNRTSRSICNHRRFRRDNKNFFTNRDVEGLEQISQGSCRVILIERFKEKLGICGLTFSWLVNPSPDPSYLPHATFPAGQQYLSSRLCLSLPTKSIWLRDKTYPEKNKLKSRKTSFLFYVLIKA